MAVRVLHILLSMCTYCQTITIGAKDDTTIPKPILIDITNKFIHSASVVFIYDNVEALRDIDFIRSRYHEASTVISLSTARNIRKDLLNDIVVNRTRNYKISLLCFCFCKLKTILDAVGVKAARLRHIKFFVLNHSFNETVALVQQHTDILCIVHVLEMKIKSNIESEKFLGGPQEQRHKSREVAAVLHGSLRTSLQCLATDDLAKWNENYEMIWAADVRKTFSGQRFTISVNHLSPVFTFKKNGTELIPISGIDYSLLKVLASKLNFTYSLITPADGKWGSQSSDGSWDGMIKQVLNKEAHFSITSITMTEERQEAVDFSDAYYFDEVGFVTLVPGYKHVSFMLLRPFEWELWIAMVSLTLISGGILTCLIKAGERVRQTARPRFEPLWYIVGTLGLIENQSIPNLSHIRIFLGAWWVFIFIMMKAYSGILTSIMSVPEKDIAIDSVEILRKLVADNRVKCGAFKRTSYWDEFQKVPELRSKLISVETIATTDEESLHPVLEGNFAFMTSILYLKDAVRRHGAEKFLFPKDSFFRDTYGIAFPRGCLYTDLFNSIIWKALQTGLIFKWSDNELGKSKPIPIVDEKRNEPIVSLESIHDAMYVLALGHTLAILTAIYQFLKNKSRLRRLRDNRSSVRRK